MRTLSKSRRNVDRLYADLQPQLMRILASNLRAADDVIEDACQSAWSSFLSHRTSPAPGSELGWLATTATRTALRVMRAQGRQVSLEESAEPVRLSDRRAPGPEPDRVLAVSERLAEVRVLPVRQQRLVWLQGLGYEYAEIAAVTGESPRSVQRQLSRARKLLAHAGEID